MNTDVLIIGSGIAGLSAAIYIAEKNSNLNIDILTKDIPQETNTQYAQGGIAAVWDLEKDSLQSHIQDTLIAGDGLCNRSVVEFVVQEGPERVGELIKWGTAFDQSNNAYELGVEGGHSHNRILHHKDITGSEIHRALMQKCNTYNNINIHKNVFAVDLITQHHLGRNITRLTPDIECYGAYVLSPNENQVSKFLSKICILATGGIGECYKATTNPPIATGDGIAMCYRAKGRIANMEFVQFHPTSLYEPMGSSPSFLISEAVRGFGAELVDAKGQPFMKKYDQRGSLAPRDIVARAIDSEMKRSGEDHVYLDCTKIETTLFQENFPNIYQKCTSIGLNIEKDLIPVVPAAHYGCGGIVTNEQGQSSILRLYAIGECSFTGLHGANRLASNSLLEAMVFGRRTANHILKQVINFQIQKQIPDWNAERTMDPGEKVLLTQSLKELKDIMSFYVRIVRSDERLKRAMDRLELLYLETERLYRKSVLSTQLCELRNMITIGYLITRSAMQRKESRGLHFNSDYAQKNERFVENTFL
jgi:L-aspartate oxidase